jgi:hypothetical protein
MGGRNDMDNPQAPSPARSDWPVVTPDDIVIADFEYDLAYMGVYLRLEICNISPYLVREAELLIEGRGPADRASRTRELKVGPLLPGVRFHAEIGLGAPGGIQGVSFDSLAARAVRLTPPDQLAPPSDYPELAAEILDVTDVKEAPDLRRRDDDDLGEPQTAEAKVIRILVRNGGPRVVEMVRLKLDYFRSGDVAAAGQAGLSRYRAAKWIFDMPRRDWNPYQLSGPEDEAYPRADPLRPGQTYEFSLVHFDGQPHGWAGSREALSVEVCGLKIAA